MIFAIEISMILLSYMANKTFSTCKIGNCRFLRPSQKKLLPYLCIEGVHRKDFAIYTRIHLLLFGISMMVLGCMYETYDTTSTWNMRQIQSFAYLKESTIPNHIGVRSYRIIQQTLSVIVIYILKIELYLSLTSDRGHLVDKDILPANGCHTLNTNVGSCDEHQSKQ